MFDAGSFVGGLIVGGLISLSNVLYMISKARGEGVPSNPNPSKIPKNEGAEKGRKQ